jgi:hypothetical protein
MKKRFFGKSAPDPRKTPVHIFTGELGRMFSLHHPDAVGNDATCGLLTWPRLITNGSAAAFADTQRAQPNWTGNKIGHPYIAYSIFAGETATYGLSQFDSKFPDDDSLVGGLIIVKQGDAQLHDESLVLQGAVSVTCNTNPPHLHAEREFRTVTITPGGEILFQ